MKISDQNLVSIWAKTSYVIKSLLKLQNRALVALCDGINLKTTTFKVPQSLKHLATQKHVTMQLKSAQSKTYFIWELRSCYCYLVVLWEIEWVKWSVCLDWSSVKHSNSVNSKGRLHLLSMNISVNIDILQWRLEKTNKLE